MNLETHAYFWLMGEKFKYSWILTLDARKVKILVNFNSPYIKKINSTSRHLTYFC